MSRYLQSRQDSLSCCTTASEYSAAASSNRHHLRDPVRRSAQRSRFLLPSLSVPLPVLPLPECRCPYPYQLAVARVPQSACRFATDNRLTRNDKRDRATADGKRPTGTGTGNGIQAAAPGQRLTGNSQQVREAGNAFYFPRQTRNGLSGVPFHHSFGLSDRAIAK